MDHEVGAAGYGPRAFVGSTCLTLGFTGMSLLCLAMPRPCHATHPSYGPCDHDTALSCVCAIRRWPCPKVGDSDVRSEIGSLNPAQHTLTTTTNKPRQDQVPPKPQPSPEASKSFLPSAVAARARAERATFLSLTRPSHGCPRPGQHGLTSLEMSGQIGACWQCIVRGAQLRQHGDAARGQTWHVRCLDAGNVLCSRDGASKLSMCTGAVQCGAVQSVVPCSRADATHPMCPKSGRHVEGLAKPLDII